MTYITYKNNLFFLCFLDKYRTLVCAIIFASKCPAPDILVHASLHDPCTCFHSRQWVPLAEIGYL